MWLLTSCICYRIWPRTVRTFGNKIELDAKTSQYGKVTLIRFVTAVVESAMFFDSRIVVHMNLEAQPL